MVVVVNFAFLLPEQYTGITDIDILFPVFLSRGVNQTREFRVSIFFSIPGKEFLDFRESRLTRPPDNRPICERDNCHRSLRACYQSIACCFTAAVARILNARDADATKQRTLAYLSGRGRGNLRFCRRELITIVTPRSRPGNAKTAASVGLYSVYRKK